MTQVFLNLINISITASWLILAIIILRLVFKKIPKFIICVLWALVALRLILPFNLESMFSLVPSRETIPPNIEYSRAPQIDTGIESINIIVNPIIQENFTPPDELTSMNPIQLPIYLGAYIWQAGIVILLLYALVSYIRVRLKVRERIKLEGNIYLCDSIPSPFILGIIKPKIYLPSCLTDEEISYVTAHEKAHLKRFDHIRKLLGYILLTVYWFNPALWIGYILLCRDIEYACDEKVIKGMDVDKKKEYSRTLLKLSINKRYVTACPLAFGESGVKGRIKSILNYKKPVFWLIVVSIVLCVVMAVCFLTNPVSGIIPGTKYDDVDKAVIDAYLDSYAFSEASDGSYLEYLIMMYYNQGLKARLFIGESYKSGEMNYSLSAADYICDVKLTDKGATLYLNKYAENHTDTTHAYPIGTELLTLKVDGFNVETYWTELTPSLPENKSNVNCFVRKIAYNLYNNITFTEIRLEQILKGYDVRTEWSINENENLAIPVNGYSLDDIATEMKDHCNKTVTEILLHKNYYTVNSDGIVCSLLSEGEITYSDYSISDLKIITGHPASENDVATAILKRYCYKNDPSSPYKEFLYTFKKVTDNSYIITDIVELKNGQATPVEGAW